MFPFTCEQCRKITMVSLDSLVKVRTDKIRTSAGFVCAHCDRFQEIYCSTSSLEDAFAKLRRIDRHRKDFRFHFAKVLKKALGIQDG